MSLVVGILAVAVLLCLAAVFAAAESIVAHVGLARASTLAEEGKRRGEILGSVLSRREEALSVMVLLRLMAQVGVVGIVIIPANDQGVSGRSWVVVAAAIVLVLAVVEVVSRAASLIHSDAAALRLVPLVWLAMRIPVLGQIAALPGRVVRRSGVDGEIVEAPRISEEELLAFAEVAAAAEVIEVEEGALIKSIIEFGDTIVREVMVPRPDMITVDATWQVGNVMEVVILNGYSRIPVTGDSIDDVVGIVYAKDLMRAERDQRHDDEVGLHVRPSRFVPEQKRVAELLPEMQAQQFHMAIVIDEYGGVAGLVTLEDLIEELVGEIVDEFDVEDPMIEPLSGGAYRVNAKTPLDEVNDLLGVALPTGDWNTVGGLLIALFGRVPAAGESVDEGRHRLTVAKVQGRRIGMVRIDRLPESESAGDESVAS